MPFSPLPPDCLQRPAFALFESVAARDPSALALTDGTDRISFGALRGRALALARQIDAAVPAGAAVAMLLPQSRDAVVGVLACLAASRIALPLNADHPAERNAAILRDSGVAAVIVSDAGSAIALPDGVPRIVPRRDSNRATADDWLPPPAAPDEPAIVLYTSGSTGRPKGIVQSQRAIICRARQNLSAQHLNPADRVVVFSAVCSVAGLISSLAVLLSGAALYQVPVLSISKMLSIVRSEQITVLMGLPAVLGLLLTSRAPGNALASVRMIRTTGDALLRGDIDAWRKVLSPACHVNITYGLTEVAIAQWFVPRRFASQAASLPAGFPMADQEFAIVGESGEPVADGEPGELVVRSPHVACGEWQDGRCVPGRMQPDPADPARRIFHTGDVVRLLPDGMLRFVARSDRQVRIRGQRVEPAEIEEVLRRSPGVADAAVVARTEDEETTLLAFVVGAGEDLQLALEQRLRQHLPSFMRPAAILVVAALPRLPGGKVDQRALLALAASLPF